MHALNKEYACNAIDLGLIPGSGRSPGEQNGYPLQYSGLENSMDCMWELQRVRHDGANFTSLRESVTMGILSAQQATRTLHSSSIITVKM